MYTHSQTFLGISRLYVLFFGQIVIIMPIFREQNNNSTTEPFAKTLLIRLYNPLEKERSCIFFLYDDIVTVNAL